jgi:hypothetical protein
VLTFAAPDCNRERAGIAGRPHALTTKGDTSSGQWPTRIAVRTELELITGRRLLPTTAEDDERWG